MTPNLYALLVGINEYQAPVDRLRGCVNDVNAMCVWLSERMAAGGRTPAEVKDQFIHLLTDAQATRQAVIDGFRQHLAQAGPQDVALFYYSGHGSQQPSPREFWSIEPDHQDETLVCYDSRQPGSHDLADKELAVLIAEVAERGAHVVVILDCCHSGSGTRDLRLKPQGIRWTAADLRPRPLDTFIDTLAAQASRGAEAAPAEISVPLGRHILLAACQPDESAKEVNVGEATWGGFSYFLRATLEANTQTLSYRDLFNQAYTRVRASIRQQTPQLEAAQSADVEMPFLGGALPQRPPYFTAYASAAGWEINGGGIHGLIPPTGSETTTLALYPLQAAPDEMRQPSRAAAQARLTQLLPQFSRLEITQGSPDEQQTYRAVVLSTPLPPVAVRLEGDADAVELARAAIATAGPGGAASPYLHLVESGSDLLLQAQDGHFRLLRPSDGHLLAPLLPGYTPQNAALTVQRLEHIARWVTTRDLGNPASDIQPGQVQLSVWRNDVEVPPQEMTFSYRLEGNRWRQPAFTVKVKNKSPFTLYCAILGLGEDFSIANVFKPQPVVCLTTGQEHQYEMFGSVPKALWQQGITETQDVYKLVACSEPFDARALEQGELDAERSVYRSLSSGPRSPLSRLMRHLQTRGWTDREENEEDEVFVAWMTTQVVVTVQRPLDSYAVPQEGDEPLRLNWGVTVQPHPALGGRVRLAHSPIGERDLTGPGLPPVLAGERAVSTPFAFQQMRSIEPSPNSIELIGVEDYQAVTPQKPLRLDFSTPLEAGEHVLAYGHDGEFYLPLGLGRGDSPRSMHLDVQRLPPPVSASRDLKGSIRIYFHKVVGQPLGIPYPYPILAAASLDAQGKPAYEADPAKVAALVQAAQRITLFVHGFTGDSRGLLAAAPHCAPGDLWLAFDYESFNTSLEEGARLLKQRLAAAGLKPGHGKNLRLVGHSLGGVLARWFVEQEGGKEIVQRLVTVGAPHSGTPWATLQEWAALALGLALNSMTTVALPLRALSMLLGWLEKEDVTLDQIRPGSDFLKNLAASDDPGVEYHLVAGDARLALQAAGEAETSPLARLLQRLGYGAAALAFLGQANDTAVSVGSAQAVPAGRTPAPVVIPAACDHVSFFDSEPGLEALTRALKD